MHGLVHVKNGGGGTNLRKKKTNGLLQVKTGVGGPT